mmetsp:Transcript_39557/g.60437  ORF Transcript_39557/g.60437 Transcript_39557/m.60437 type:complete len:315 (-) Transcript_39557:368-1312(-)
MNKFRVNQNSLNTIRLWNNKSPLELRSNIAPFIYHMQPYFQFDYNSNPVVLVLDRSGVCLVNLKSGEVNQLQIYEDQAFQVKKESDSSPIRAVAEKGKQPNVSFDLAAEANSPLNVDMWQRFMDCHLCDSMSYGSRHISVPNTQGILIHHTSRNLIIGFNKVMHVWKYEDDPKDRLRPKTDKEKFLERSQAPASVGGLSLNSKKGFNRLPAHLRKEAEAQDEKRGFMSLKNPLAGEGVRTTLVGGIKNYEIVPTKDQSAPLYREPVTTGMKLLAMPDNTVKTYLTETERLIRGDDMPTAEKVPCSSEDNYFFLN